MSFRSLYQWLAPGLGSLLGGVSAYALGGEGPVVILSATVGAVGASLVFVREHERAVTPPSQMTGRPEVPASLPPGQGRALLDSLPMGVILIDRMSSITYANGHAADLFGLKSLADQPSSILRHPKLVDAIDASVFDRTAASIDFNLPRNTDVHLRAHLRPLDEVSGHEALGVASGILVMIEDVTQVFKSVDLHRDFVANASHELKTPLSSITGIIQTLLGHARDDPEASERFLNIMAAQTDRMKRLVEDLLSLNRIELNERILPTDRQPVRRIVWEVAESLSQFSQEHGIALDVAAPQDEPEVLGSYEELAQVFRNLIENAVKYGRPGTHVTVAVAPDTLDRPGMIGISVADHGPGIAREHLPRLTERFYRVSVSRSREKGGTGLGLAIVKHILNRHRGDLDIASVEGEGSTFTVWLPLFESDARATETLVDDASPDTRVDAA